MNEGIIMDKYNELKLKIYDYKYEKFSDNADESDKERSLRLSLIRRKSTDSLADAEKRFRDCEKSYEKIHDKYLKTNENDPNYKTIELKDHRAFLELHKAKKSLDEARKNNSAKNVKIA